MHAWRNRRLRHLHVANLLCVVHLERLRHMQLCILPKMHSRLPRGVSLERLELWWQRGVHSRLLGGGELQHDHVFTELHEHVFRLWSDLSGDSLSQRHPLQRVLRSMCQRLQLRRLHVGDGRRSRQLRCGLSDRLRPDRGRLQSRLFGAVLTVERRGLSPTVAFERTDQARPRRRHTKAQRARRAQGA